MKQHLIFHDFFFFCNPNPNNPVVGLMDPYTQYMSQLGGVISLDLILYKYIIRFKQLSFFNWMLHVFI